MCSVQVQGRTDSRVSLYIADRLHSDTVTDRQMVRGLRTRFSAGRVTPVAYPRKDAHHSSFSVIELLTNPRASVTIRV
jgi:hypothetical protein